MFKNLYPLLIVLVVIFVGGLAVFLIMTQNTKTGSNPLDYNPQATPTGIVAATSSPTPAGSGQQVQSVQAVQSTPTAVPTIINTQTFPDGLKIEDEKIGEGNEVKSGDTIAINYLGTLVNGQKFDSSYDRNQPFVTQIGVGQVIKGWDEGVVGMKVGGKRRLTIPPELGYGNQAAGSIPANSTLIFEVELMGIK